MVLTAPAKAAEIETPELLLAGVEAEVVVRELPADAPVTLTVAAESWTAQSDGDGVARFRIALSEAGTHDLRIAFSETERAATRIRAVPGWLSLAPPVLAIVVALLLRSVLPALMLGIWMGAATLESFTLSGVFAGLLNAFQHYVVSALADPDHAAIIVFSFMIGGMVGIITRNGGMAAIVVRLVSRAKSAIAGQLSVAAMGLLIFFDDYSNTLVVGNTARPMTDQLRISREKLAYLVDSTAAPVVCLALVTTWIGYEVGLIDASIDSLDGFEQAAYTVFLYSLPYSFYPILALLFVFVVAAGGRDMGPMLKAERRARAGTVAPPSQHELPAIAGDRLEAKPDVPLRPLNAIVPILVLIAALIAGLLATGSGDTLTDIIGSADSYKAMLWASLLSVLVAAGMTIGQRILNTHETIDAWFGGVRAMFFAMIVLVLAWALSDVTGDLGTADYLVSMLADTLPPPLVPVMTFALAATTAFTTGTSWGAMGILMPLVIPLCWAILQQHAMIGPDDLHILYSSIACVLAGAVWGDHCSPISDTTVLSSMASGCDHIEHVRTQMPYALLVGVVAVGLGTIPGGFGFPPLASIAIGAVVLWAVMRILGERAS